MWKGAWNGGADKPARAQGDAEEVLRGAATSLQRKSANEGSARNTGAECNLTRYEAPKGLKASKRWVLSPAEAAALCSAMARDTARGYGVPSVQANARGRFGKLVFDIDAKNVAFTEMEYLALASFIGKTTAKFFIPDAPPAGPSPEGEPLHCMEPLDFALATRYRYGTMEPLQSGGAHIVLTSAHMSRTDAFRAFFNVFATLAVLLGVYTEADGNSGSADRRIGKRTASVVALDRGGDAPLSVDMRKSIVDATPEELKAVVDNAKRLLRDHVFVHAAKLTAFPKDARDAIPTLSLYELLDPLPTVRAQQRLDLAPKGQRSFYTRCALITVDTAARTVGVDVPSYMHNIRISGGVFRPQDISALAETVAASCLLTDATRPQFLTVPSARQTVCKDNTLWTPAVQAALAPFQIAPGADELEGLPARLCKNAPDRRWRAAGTTPSGAPTPPRPQGNDPASTKYVRPQPRFPTGAADAEGVHGRYVDGVCSLMGVNLATPRQAGTSLRNYLSQRGVDFTPVGSPLASPSSTPSPGPWPVHGGCDNSESGEDTPQALALEREQDRRAMRSASRATTPLARDSSATVGILRAALGIVRRVPLHKTGASPATVCRARIARACAASLQERGKKTPYGGVPVRSGHMTAVFLHSEVSDEPAVAGLLSFLGRSNPAFRLQEASRIQVVVSPQTSVYGLYIIPSADNVHRIPCPYKGEAHNSAFNYFFVPFDRRFGRVFLLCTCRCAGKPCARVQPVQTVSKCSTATAARSVCIKDNDTRRALKDLAKEIGLLIDVICRTLAEEKGFVDKNATGDASQCIATFVRDRLSKLKTLEAIETAQARACGQDSRMGRGTKRAHDDDASFIAPKRQKHARVDATAGAEGGVRQPQGSPVLSAFIPSILK